MRIPRVYDDQPLRVGDEVSLGDFAAQHLGRVLRMKAGDPLTIFNGQGGEYGAVLTTVTKKHVFVQLQDFREPVVDSILKIHLGQCLSRGERMDYAVQKACELGVCELSPLFSERCEVRLKADRQEKRVQHWQQIAISASEQSLRCSVPHIHQPTDAAQWVTETKADLKLVLDPRAPQALTSFNAPASIALLIGPEGGLSEAEVNAAEVAGFMPIALGPRVLRTETAPVAALSLLQYLWGDLN
ncbi:MAG: 16S rRNA (uracil(1498)-N(3))-methyltransferase [Motiliproteus sp.]